VSRAAEITRLAWHFSPHMTEQTGRHQLRPVIAAGVGAMDKIFI
jgi:hypothetical protein